jgi:hypothetical protein
MMIEATIVKRRYEPFSFKRLPDERETIQAADRASLYALFFREYANRYKYCNSISYSLDDPEMHQGYQVWFSDIRNYADNGGDMW